MQPATWGILALATALPGAPPNVVGDAATKDALLESLKGKWVLVTTTERGRARRYTERSIVFNGHEYRFYVKDLLVRKAEVVASAAARPYSLDLYQQFGPNKGKVLHSIFKLDRGMLTIADGFYDGDRPTEFDSRTPTCFSVTVWKRQKK